jgi:uncharacterized repeat protein (TIGR02059 family)
VATITVDPDTVTHTLPDAFYGWNFAAFFHSDATVASWQSAMNSIAPEIMRAHMWGYPYDYAGHTNCRNGFAALNPQPKVSLQGDAFPASVPATLSPVDTGNRPSASNKSPSGVDDLLQGYLDAGLDVQWYEPYNEPTNCVSDASPATNKSWYASWTGYGNGQTAQQIRRHSESWAIVHARHWTIAVDAKVDSLGRSIKRLWHSWGSSGNDSFNENSMIQTIDGTPLPNGQTNPNSTDSNLAYFDVLNIHAYPGGSGSTEQGRVNSYAYPTYTQSKGSIYGTWLKARAVLDARDSTKMIAFNEGPSLPDDRAVGSFEDVLLALLACVYQSKFKIDHAVFHSANRGIVGDEGHSIFDPSVTPSSSTLNTRGRVHRDLISPFIRLYKRQLIGGASASNPPSEIAGSGSTPASSQDNSVPRIWSAAGLNEAGDTIGFLLANLDKTNNESVTLEFGATATGDATYAQLDRSTAGQNTTPPTGTFPTDGNTSHTFTLAAGDAYLIQVPVEVGGDVTAPTRTGGTIDTDDAVLDYNEILDDTSVPQNSDFVVLVNGSSRPVITVDISGSDVLLTLSSAVDSDDVVTVSYTRGSGREIKDAAGNLAANFSGQSLTNITAPISPNRVAGGSGRVVGTREDNTSGRIPDLGGGGI